MAAPRITGDMIARGVLGDLHTVADRLARTQAKISSGKELTRPSDDPFAVGRAMTLRSELEGLRQYGRNAQEAIGWLDATESSLKNVTSALHRASELLVQARNPVPQTSLDSIALEIDALIDAIKQEGNATFGDRYVFAGTATTTAPYDLGTTPPYDDTYHGDNGGVARTIGSGVSVEINVRADAVLGDDTTGLISVLRDAAANLRAGDRAALGVNGTQLKQELETILEARAAIGATTNRIEAATGRISELEGSVQRLLSETEDADMAETLIDFSMQQAVYQSALKAGAQVIQPSLLDFLR